MEYLQRPGVSENTKFYESALRIIIGFIILALGIFIAAETGIRGQGIGYVLIIGAPFIMLPEKKTLR